MKRLVQTMMVLTLLLLGMTGCSDLKIQKVSDPFVTTLPPVTEPPPEEPTRPLPTEPSITIEGQWYTQLDMSQAVWYVMEEAMGGELEATSAPFPVTLCLEFMPGDQFRTTMQIEEEDIESFMDDYLAVVTEYTYRMAEEEGISQEELDQLCKQETGVGLETYMKLIKIQAVSTLKEELQSSGSNGYYILEGNLLYTADTRKKLEERENCLEISVDENQFIILNVANITPEDEEIMALINLEFPWVFDRQYSF